MTSTPFGEMTSQQAKLLTEKKVAYQNEQGDWIFFAEKVLCKRFVEQENGREKMLEKEYIIPVRAYNLEYLSLKEGLQKALDKVDNAYLPIRFGFNSYQALLDAAKKGQYSAEQDEEGRAIENIDWSSI